MATQTIEQYLPYTASYINFVFYGDEERCGHHNYVVEQNIINSSPCIAEMSAEQLSEFDQLQFKQLRQLDNYCPAVVIRAIEEFSDLAEIVDVYGQGCNYPTKKGLDGFQVNMDVTLYINKTKSDFHIVFQSADRSDNLKHHASVDMTRAQAYGCDADESSELISMCNDEEWAIAYLESIADAIAKKYFLNNYKD